MFACTHNGLTLCIITLTFRVYLIFLYKQESVCSLFSIDHSIDINFTPLEIRMINGEGHLGACNL